MASGGHLGFSIFFIFRHMEHFCVNIRVYMSNFMTIGLTVQKLLAFTFSIGNALKVPKIGVLGDFRGENCNIYLSKPQKAPLCPKHAFWGITRPNRSTALIRGPIPRVQKMASGGHLGFSFLSFFIIWHIFRPALESTCQISWLSDLRFKSY